MQKRFLVLLGLVIFMGLSVSQAMAHSTIYVDEIGRMHFLGKDNGAKTLQKVEDYSNPAQQDVTNATFKPVETAKSEVKEDKNVKAVNSSEKAVKTGKTKGSFTSTKGSMDASNPYTYGGSNISDKPNVEDLSKKRFWQIW